VPDPFRVHEAIFVLDLDPKRAGAVRGSGNRSRQLAMSQPRSDQQRVAAPKRDAAAHDHL
jgi:hypothetical protein